MKKYITYALILIILLCLYFILLNEKLDAETIKYISSCELDLDNDNNTDLVLLIDTIRGRELIALIKIENGYKAYLISKGKVYEINGAYIKLSVPESSSVVYFWTDSGFKEVWISD